MISYVHPDPRRAAASAQATAPVDETGSVHLRPGQTVNLSTLAAQRAADQRAQETHGHSLRHRRTSI